VSAAHPTEAPQPGDAAEPARTPPAEAAAPADASRPADAGLRVVAVTYFPGETLAAFLDSLAEATRRPYAVVLADNARRDPVPRAAARDRAEVRRVELPRNLGYGAAANVAAAGADEPWLLVANPDVTFSAGSLDTLLDAAQRWPAAGSLGPAILTPDGQLYPSARALPSLGRGIGHALLGWWWPANPWTAAYRRERGTPQEGPVGWLSGSCLLLRRSAFEAVGGFDPSFFMYFEDLDLCDRLGAAGFANVYVPSAVITHAGGHSTSRHAARMTVEHHRSAYRYLSRRYAGPARAPLRALLAAGLLGRAVLALGLQQLREGARPTRSADVLPGRP